MKRRDFLRSAAGLPAAAAFSLGDRAAAQPAAPPVSPPARSRVVHVQDHGARLESGAINEARIGAMLDRAMMRLTDTADPAAAWSALFSASDVVGIKVNCLAGPGLSSHPELVGKIVLGLRLAGVAPRNIHIWERSTQELARAGFKPDPAGIGGARIAGIDGRYDPEITFAGAVGGCFAPVVSRICTAHINVPVLKDHYLAGVGVGMKSFYGAIHNPNKYHENHCDPFVADLCAHPLIRDRLRLVICDALNGQYDGGPTRRPDRQWREDALMLSRDPVALDAEAWRLLDEQRVQAGLKTIAEDGREPRWLATAVRYGLGHADPERIEAIRI